MRNRVDMQTDQEKMAHIAATAEQCACDHGHHSFGKCPGVTLYKGVLLKCPCRECFCYLCFKEQRRQHADE